MTDLDICHAILDLLVSFAAPLKSHQSPTSPSEAKPRRVASLSAISSTAAPFPSATELTKLKIALRERSHQRSEAGNGAIDVEVRASKRIKLLAGLRSRPEEAEDSQLLGREGLGRDDVTVRFIFGTSDPQVPLVVEAEEASINAC